MSLLAVVLTLIVIGVLLWLVCTYIPMQPAIKNIMIAVVVIAVVIWLLQITGMLGHVGSVPMPHR